MRLSQYLTKLDRNSFRGLLELFQLSQGRLDALGHDGVGVGRLRRRGGACWEQAQSGRWGGGSVARRGREAPPAPSAAEGPPPKRPRRPPSGETHESDGARGGPVDVANSRGRHTRLENPVGSRLWDLDAIQHMINMATMK